MPLMRPAILLVCTLAFALSVHASDHAVCNPFPDDKDGQCPGDDELPAATPAAVTATAAASTRESSSAKKTLDWVPRAELSVQQLSVLPEYCAGAYVEPAFPVALGTDPNTLPLQVQAGELQYWLQDRVEFTDAVRLSRGNQTLLASRATFHEAEQKVTVDDGITLREPGMLVEGRTAELMVATGAASVSDAEFVLQTSGLRGTAQILDRNANGDVRVSRGSFTRCEPGNNNWRVTGSSVQIDEGAKFGTARDAFLRVHDVPIFYAPYIRFPVTDERMSGWLFPDVGVGDANGTDIAVPYYLNLAPNYDATLTPRYISDRGVGIAGDVRHLSRYGGTEVGGAFLSRDHEYNGEYSRADFDSLGLPGSFDPADRWLFATKQHGSYGDFQTLIDTEKVSDLDYFRDLGTGGLAASSQVEIQQFGEVRYGLGGLSGRVWAQDFQRLDVDVVQPYRRLPEIDLNYQTQLTGKLHGSIDSSWASFDRPNDQFTGIQRINGERLNIEPRIGLPFDWAPGYVHFMGGYRYTRYSLDDVPIATDHQAERKIWLGSVDSGLFFERDTSAFGTATVQTLEPRLFYLYQQYRNQDDLPQFDVSELSFTFDQLFRDNRFAGIDRIGDANQLTAALTTRWLDAQTGQERVQASVGQIVYFTDRRVTLDGLETADDRHRDSAYAGQIAATLGTAFNFRTTGTWDPNDGDWNEIGAAMQYRPDSRHIFNLGYRRRNDTQPVLKQSDVSLYWSFFRQWSLIGRFDYDLEEHRSIEAFGGLEYSDCCWQIRVVGRKYLLQPGATVAPDTQTDEAIFFQIAFKGLAGFGGRIDSFIQAGIPGYVAEDF